MFFGWDVNFSRCWELFPKLYEKIDFTKWWGMPFVTDNYLPQKFSSPSGGFEWPGEEMIEKNYDNPSEILQIINQHKELVHKHVILFNLPETLKS